MLVRTLLVAHIAVLGYWLGSELVINSTFRYVTRTAVLPFAERKRLLDHVMNVDQHVRYALALQLGLGLALAALLGFLPGGNTAAIAAAIAAALLVLFVEITHRLRSTVSGGNFARIDRAIRYVAVLLFATLGFLGLAGRLVTPTWLSLKLVLFGAAIACGLGIRLELIKYFATFAAIGSEGSSVNLEADLYGRYHRATGVLIGLWVVIAAITLLSIWKP